MAEYVGLETSGHVLLETTGALLLETSPTIVSWAWDFGDGGTSTLQNPTHSYTVGGTYTVTLTVTSSNGATDGETKVAYVAAGAPVTVHGSSVVSLTTSVTTAGTVTPAKHGVSVVSETVTITTAGIVHALVHGTAVVAETVTVTTMPVATYFESVTVLVNVAVTTIGHVYGLIMPPLVLTPEAEDFFTLNPVSEDSFVLIPVPDPIP